MKKKNLLTISICTLMMLFNSLFAEPVKVEFSAVPNPTGDTENPFPMYISYGQELWGDYNNDGKLDRFIIGGNGSQNFYLYLNEGAYFTKVVTGVTPLAAATAVLLDYDNDGNLDLMIAGKDQNNSSHNELWRNTGAIGNYEFVKDETFPNFGIVDHEYQSRCNYLIAADYDNDGWTDFLATGHVDGDWYAKLYRNNLGYFEEVEYPVDDNLGRRSLPRVVKGSIQAADLNNDGYVDLIISGENADNGFSTMTTVYFNNGDGTFKSITDDSVFQGQNRGTTFAVDVNNDGYLDLVEMGDNNDDGRDIGDGRKRVANIYINNGNETFGAPIVAENNGILEMRAMPSVGDVNNDGFTDILATGGWEDDFTHLYYNNGDNTFTNEFIPREFNGRDGIASIVDFDGDEALDISIEGWCDGWHNVLLINDWTAGLARPEAPSIPTNFNITQSGDDVILSWNKSTDDTTPQDAIRYNIYIQSKVADNEGYIYTFTYAPADIATGQLKWTGKPHFISGTTITMKGFNASDYNFGVQAVDNGWLTSAFTSVSTNILSTADSSNIKVTSTNGKINVLNANNYVYSVYNLQGQIVASDIKGNESIEVLKGSYVVKIKDMGGKSTNHKIIVL